MRSWHLLPVGDCPIRSRSCDYTHILLTPTGGLTGFSLFVRVLDSMLDGNHYFLSPRIKTLKAIRAKIRPEPVRGPLPPPTEPVRSTTCDRSEEATWRAEYAFAVGVLGMDVDKREERIELAVSSSFAPGLTWWSRLEAVASGGVTTITDTVGEGWEDSPGEVRSVRTASTSDCFRGLVSLLTADDAEGGIPVGVIDDVRVFGLEGWKADFAKFCWVRDEENFPLLGRDFVDFDDWHLEHLFKQAGALSDLYKIRNKVAKPAFYDSFWRLVREDRDDVEALADRKLSDIVKYLNLLGRPDFWDAMVITVHDLAERARSDAETANKRREAQLAPIRAYAERAQYQQISGPMQGLGNALISNGIVEYVEAYLKQTAKYPVGRHTVLCSSGISGNRALPRTRAVEVDFPEE
jgi:hypothetical protein